MKNHIYETDYNNNEIFIDTLTKSKINNFKSSVTPFILYNDIYVYHETHATGEI